MGGKWVVGGAISDEDRKNSKIIYYKTITYNLPWNSRTTSYVLSSITYWQNRVRNIILASKAQWLCHRLMGW